MERERTYAELPKVRRLSGLGEDRGSQGLVLREGAALAAFVVVVRARSGGVAHAGAGGAALRGDAARSVDLPRRADGAAVVAGAASSWPAQRAARESVVAWRAE